MGTSSPRGISRAVGLSRAPCLTTPHTPVRLDSTATAICKGADEAKLTEQSASDVSTGLT